MIILKDKKRGPEYWVSFNPSSIPKMHIKQVETIKKSSVKDKNELFAPQSRDEFYKPDPYNSTLEMFLHNYPSLESLTIYHDPTQVTFLPKLSTKFHNLKEI